MSISRIAQALLTAVLLAGCAAFSGQVALNPHDEPWEFAFDGRDWKLGYAQADGAHTIREYVLPGERVEHWTELVSSMSFEDPVTPRSLYAASRTQLMRDCSFLEMSVLDENADSLVYEFRHKGCVGNPAQNELRRITNAPGGTYSLAYVEKTAQIAPERREQWLAILRAAKIRPE